MLLILTACADPVAQQASQAREDARLRVFGDAMFYWRCEHQAVIRAGECDQWSEAFERDRAAFVARYGDGSE